MKKTKVNLYREKDGSYSCFMDSDLPYSLIGEGVTAKDAMDEWLHSYEDMRGNFEKRSEPFVESEFQFVYDVPSMLNYYAGKLSFAGLSKITGISAAQLSQYAHGYRNPSAKTSEKIQNALHLFGTELTELVLV